MIATRWVVVVRPDQAALCPRLQASFDREFVEVLVDRRQAERRRAHGGVAAERRRGDRRQPAVSRFRLRHEGDGFRVYEAEGLVLVRCAECEETLEYEMPHFREPPARLSVALQHVQKAIFGTLRPASSPDVQVQHAVEVEAFSAAGRLLLCCRVPARPPGLPPAAAADELEVLPAPPGTAPPTWGQGR